MNEQKIEKKESLKWCIDKFDVYIYMTNALNISSGQIQEVMNQKGCLLLKTKLCQYHSKIVGNKSTDYLNEILLPFKHYCIQGFLFNHNI